MAGPRALSALPRLDDKLVIVTGGNSGIGTETCVGLARLGARVLFTARDEAKGRIALDDIRARSGAGDRVQVGSLDLASFPSIRRFAAEVLDSHDRIDVLVNNAGLVLDNPGITEQGHEMTWGVNHLGPFLLTNLLLDRLKESAPSRIVNVASYAHRWAVRGLDHVDVTSVQDYKGFDAYARSKLSNILFTRELARRLEGSGVAVNCLHPGSIRSGFGAEGDYAVLGVLIAMFGRVVLISPERGSRTSIWAAASARAGSESGQYYVRRKPHRPSKAARSDDQARRLWELSETLVAEHP